MTPGSKLPILFSALVAGHAIAAPVVTEESIEMSRFVDQNRSFFADATFVPSDRRHAAPTVANAAGVSEAPSRGGGDASPAGFFQPEPWPNGIIPYTWSETIVDAYFNGATDAASYNAGAALPATLAVMVAIEEELRDPDSGELLVKFVGYDPNVHSQVLIIDSVDVDPDLTLPPDIDGVTSAACVHTVDVGSPTLGTTGGIDLAGQATMTLCTWADFGAVSQGFGFVLGLDWEQLREDREDYIEVYPERIAPLVDGGGNQFTFPPGTFVSVDGRDGTQALFEPVDDTGLEHGDYDFFSLMHMNRFDVSIDGRPVFDIHDDVRYVDLDDDGELETDLHDVVGQATFFSEGDEDTLRYLYGLDSPFSWFLGKDPNCPADVNEDGFHSPEDILLFFELWRQGSIVADLDDDGLFTLNDIYLYYQAILNAGMGPCPEPFDGDGEAPDPIEDYRRRHTGT